MSAGLPTRTLGVASCARATFWRSGALPDKANKGVDREHQRVRTELPARFLD